MFAVVRKYHTPVMINECLEGLNIRPEGVYVDTTFGGGGHSEGILDQLTDGRLYAFDQDSEAKAEAASIDNDQLTFISANFRYMKQYLKMHGVEKVDGVLVDLGVSSHQIDDPSRGFSIKYEGKLDMRMDRDSSASAYNVLNEYTEEDMQRVFGLYGEIKNAKKLAQKIVSARVRNKIETTIDLRKIIEPLAPQGREYKYFAKVFQALRIEVNKELEALEAMLEQTPDIISAGGRLVVISYHSLEDRLVKNFVKSGNTRGELNKDFYGNVTRPFSPVTRKPMIPSVEEIEENPRSRSAKLRIAQKN